MRIYKYPLLQSGEQEINSFQDAEFLDVQVQHDEACLWVLVDPGKPPCIYTIRIYGTGHHVQEKYLKHLGTFQMMEGRFVGHVFLQLPVPRAT
jgi:hypothetical protein